MCERWLHSGWCLSADMGQKQAAVFPQIMNPWLLLIDDDEPTTDKDSFAPSKGHLHKTSYMHVKGCRDEVNKTASLYHQAHYTSSSTACLFTTSILWRHIQTLQFVLITLQSSHMENTFYSHWISTYGKSLINDPCEDLSVQSTCTSCTEYCCTDTICC